MAAKIIVSYDGTANEDDAVALGRVFARAGAEVSLAYVRHAKKPDPETEAHDQHEAEALLGRGVELLGIAGAGTHVVTDRSTPDGLAGLAEQIGAEAIVFCSDSHTAKGHIGPGNSSTRLLDGGSYAIGIAPADLGDEPDISVQKVVAVGDGGGGAEATAESLAAALGASVAPVANEETDLLVVDSRPEAAPGRVLLSASARHLIEIATSPVLVVPRGVTLAFGRSAIGVGAP
jgi:nucleotide-binding universal stress UspA family protein